MRDDLRVESANGHTAEDRGNDKEGSRRRHDAVGQNGLGAFAFGVDRMGHLLDDLDEIAEGLA